ncbi:hypothetical protein [Tenacibaculum sp. SZ-18]|nr:hypothetical protein [Tenacibaculum sp. SZ-18]
MANDPNQKTFSSQKKDKAGITLEKYNFEAYFDLSKRELHIILDNDS